MVWPEGKRNIRVILGLYWDNGKENGNYQGLYRGYIGTIGCGLRKRRGFLRGKCRAGKDSRMPRRFLWQSGLLKRS